MLGPIHLVKNHQLQLEHSQLGQSHFGLSLLGKNLYIYWNVFIVIKTSKEFQYTYMEDPHIGQSHVGLSKMSQSHLQPNITWYLPIWNGVNRICQKYWDIIPRIIFPSEIVQNEVVSTENGPTIISQIVVDPRVILAWIYWSKWYWPKKFLSQLRSSPQNDSYSIHIFDCTYFIKNLKGQ